MAFLRTYGWWVLLPILLASCGISKSVHDRPDVQSYESRIPERQQINDSVFVAGNNFLLKNTFGHWELYVEGNPLQIGKTTGLLTQELMHHQENVFFDQVETIVTSKFKQRLLRKFLAWYNRKMYLHVPEEYKVELFGLSQFGAADYSEIGDPYLRLLYLHGAHDIGHALQDLMLVGCSSFAVWNENSADGELLLARNFDFYAGDAFAENKIIAFVKPENGHPFVSVTWGGMIGVVSGMNTAGLTVTLNAGKSEIPWVAKTPISIVAREILQYASTIDEAIAIAKKREVFVSEAIMVGSALDNQAALIEIAPDNFGVYRAETVPQLLCSNHFQSDSFSDDKRNVKWIAESHSEYRFQRMDQLLAHHHDGVDVADAVAILRNTEGIDDMALGYGNEKALNQLLAHHGVVFKPESQKVWISSHPYQLGAFVEYDLNAIFNPERAPSPAKSMAVGSGNIPEDPFLYSSAFQDYEKYRILEREIERALNSKESIAVDTLEQLQKLNPEYWKAYYLTGKYYYQKKYNAAAKNAFAKALTKEITTLPDRQKIEKYLQKLN